MTLWRDPQLEAPGWQQLLGAGAAAARVGAGADTDPVPDNSGMFVYTANINKEIRITTSGEA